MIKLVYFLLNISHFFFVRPDSVGISVQGCVIKDGVNRRGREREGGVYTRKTIFERTNYISCFAFFARAKADGVVGLGPR